MTTDARLVLAVAAVIAASGAVLVVAYNRLIRHRNLMAEGKSGIDVHSSGGTI